MGDQRIPRFIFLIFFFGTGSLKGLLDFGNAGPEMR